MRRVLGVLIVLTLWSCATTAPARSPAGEDAVIRGLEDQERAALLNRDTVALQRMWAPGFIVNSPLNQISRDRGVVLDLVRRGLIHYSAFDRRIEEVRIMGNIAIVMGAESATPARAGARAVPRRFTHVWQRDAGAWRLVARHANDIIAQ
ncbi:MAG TPA: nuclear transport factor 2 family protein [Gemmatimonadaceae bacterium]